MNDANNVVLAGYAVMAIYGSVAIIYRLVWGSETKHSKGKKEKVVDENGKRWDGNAIYIDRSDVLAQKSDNNEAGYETPAFIIWE
jgi:hypothetical protein